MHNPLKLIGNVERHYLLVSSLLFLIVGWVAFSEKQGPLIELYDYWEHAACINELSANLLNPPNPLLHIEERNTLRYTPYIFLAALFKKLSHLNLFTVIKILSLTGFLLLTGGIYLWSKEYFQDEKVPLYVLTALLFLWGRPFNYSNEYNLRFLSYTLFYPSIFTFSLSFPGLFFLLNYIRYGKRTYYFLYLLTASFIFVSHPLTGSFFLMCAFLLIITEDKNRLKNCGLYLFGLCIIAVLSLVWPYHSFIKAVVDSTTTDWYFPFRMYLYSPVIIYKMGPALLGLPIVMFLLINKKYYFISGGFVLCSFIYVLSYFLNIRLGERYVFFVMVFLHLALAWYFSRLELLSFRKMRDILMHLNERNVYLLFFWIILALSVSYQIVTLGFEQAGYTIRFEPRPVVQKYKNPLDNYKRLHGKIKAGDIVLSDTLTSWPIPAFTGAKIISLYHDNPMVPDNNKRLENAVKFYDSRTALAERRKIAQRYSVTHVLLNFDRMKDTPVNRINNYFLNFRIGESLIQDLKKMGAIILQNDGFILFKLYENSKSMVE